MPFFSQNEGRLMTICPINDDCAWLGAWFTEFKGEPRGSFQCGCGCGAVNMLRRPFLMSCGVCGASLGGVCDLDN